EKGQAHAAPGVHGSHLLDPAPPIVRTGAALASHRPVPPVVVQAGRRALSHASIQWHADDGGSRAPCGAARDGGDDRPALGAAPRARRRPRGPDRISPLRPWRPVLRAGTAGCQVLPSVGRTDPHLGTWYQQRGELEQAEQAYLHAVELKPQ